MFFLISVCKTCNEPCFTRADPLKLLKCHFQWGVLVSHPGLNMFLGGFRGGDSWGGKLSVTKTPKSHKKVQISKNIGAGFEKSCQ